MPLVSLSLRASPTGAGLFTGLGLAFQALQASPALSFSTSIPAFPHSPPLVAQLFSLHKVFVSVM